MVSFVKGWFRLAVLEPSAHSTWAAVAAVSTSPAKERSAIVETQSSIWWAGKWKRQDGEERGAGWRDSASPGQLDKKPHTNFVVRGKSAFRTGKGVAGDKDETSSFCLIVRR